MKTRDEVKRAAAELRRQAHGLSDVGLFGEDSGKAELLEWASDLERCLGDVSVTVGSEVARWLAGMPSALDDCDL